MTTSWSVLDLEESDDNSSSGSTVDMSPLNTPFAQETEVTDRRMEAKHGRLQQANKADAADETSSDDGFQSVTKSKRRLARSEKNACFFAHREEGNKCSRFVGKDPKTGEKYPYCDHHYATETRPCQEKGCSEPCQLMNHPVGKFHSRCTEHRYKQRARFV